MQATMISGTISETRRKTDLDAVISEIAGGSREALRELYSECSRGIYSYALSILKNASDAEDALHDVFIKVYESAPSYKGRNKAMNWMLTITRNICYSRFREMRNTAEMPEEYALPDTVSSSVEDRMVLRACLDSLNDDEREILVLKASGGLRFREISALTEMPLGTVLSKYRRAIAKLNRLFSQEESK